jgi:hypothetical protein
MAHGHFMGKDVSKVLLLPKTGRRHQVSRTHTHTKKMKK